jgi:uncharacterized protein
MTLSKDYIDGWQAWHDARIADLNRPYGWMAVVSQDWLEEGVPFANGFVPGTFLLEDGEIDYCPDAEATARGELVTIDGVPATERTRIPHGYNVNSGTGSAVPVFFGDLEIETLTRLNAQDETIYAVRVRDPEQAAAKRFDDIETFPLAEEWIVPAAFTPSEMDAHSVQTVEDGIYETGFTIGTMALEIRGETYTVEVFGHRGGSAATGYFADSTFVHLGDPTNRKNTYGGGRVVNVDPSELPTMTELDLNKLVSLPCALSTFVACAATPLSNRLPFEIHAGELTPPVEHERVATYVPKTTAAAG